MDRDENHEIRRINEFLDGIAIQDMEIEVRPVENPPRVHIVEIADDAALPQPPVQRNGLDEEAGDPNPARPRLAQRADLAPVRINRNPALNAEEVEGFAEPRRDPEHPPPAPVDQPVAGRNNNRQRFAPYRGNRAGYRVRRQRRAREFVQFLGMLRRQAFQN